MIAPRLTPASLVLVLAICIPLSPTSAQPVTPLVPMPAVIQENQTTWYVDDDAPNDPGPGDPTVSDPLEDGTSRHPFDAIQEALDAAVAGDSVLVADGTYSGHGNRNLRFRGKAVTLQSESNNPRNCVVDAQGQGSVFIFTDEEGRGSVIEGITITGGLEYYGAAIKCINASPTIRRCIISGNEAKTRGTVFCERYSNPVIQGCLITDNHSFHYGSAIQCDRSAPTIINCTITRNSTLISGGAVSSHNSSSAIMIGCIVWNNFPNSFHLSRPEVSYSLVEGGIQGVGNLNVDPEFSFSGDAHLSATSPCIDAGPIDPQGVEAAIDLDGNPRILDGDGFGGNRIDIGVYEFNSSAPSIAVSPTVIDLFVEEGDAQSNAANLIVRNAGGGVLDYKIENPCDWLSIRRAPPPSPTDVHGFVMRANTEALSHGNYTCTLSISDPAAANSPRLVRVTVHVHTTLFVPAQFATIQAAIDAAVAPRDVVVVSEGLYTGVGNTELDYRGREITVRSAHGAEHSIIDCEGQGTAVRISAGETARTVLEGFTITNAERGIYTERASPIIRNCRVTFCENALEMRGGAPHVISCQINNNVALDTGAALIGGGIYGAVFENCDFSDNASSFRGAIECIGAAEPLFANCTFRNNRSGRNGAAMWYDSNHPLIFRDCEFSNNESDGHGGAIATRGWSTVTFERCVFRDNHAGVSPSGSSGAIACWSKELAIAESVFIGNSAINNGGAVTFGGDRLRVFNSTFVGNSAGGDGGAIRSGETDLAVLANCLFAGNTAGGRGGALYTYKGEPQVLNCVLQGNDADNAGAMFFFGGHPITANSILWSNEATAGTEIVIAESSYFIDYLTIDHCIVDGGSASVVPLDGAWLVWGENNSDENPRFIDLDGADNDPATFEDNDYRLAPGSLCIDAGDNTRVPLDWFDLDADGDSSERLPIDLDGDQRFSDDTGTPDTGNGLPPLVDIGAFEFQGRSCFGDLDSDSAIGLSDLATLLASYGATSGVSYGGGDLDGDGDVDLEDLATLLVVYGTACE